MFMCLSFRQSVIVRNVGNLLLQTPNAVLLLLYLTLSSIYTCFNTLKEKMLQENFAEKGEIALMSNFTFFRNVFYVPCIL